MTTSSDLKKEIISQPQENSRLQLPKGMEESKKADDLSFEFDCDRSAPQNEVIYSQMIIGICQHNLV